MKTKGSRQFDSTSMKMIDKKSWEDFANSGLFWWVNMLLHTFGWAIVMEKQGDEIISVYPARVKFRGFDEQTNTNGYIKVSEFMKENAKELLKESMD